jgi:hypothetical protein
LPRSSRRSLVAVAGLAGVLGCATTSTTSQQVTVSPENAAPSAVGTLVVCEFDAPGSPGSRRVEEHCRRVDAAGADELESHDASPAAPAPVPPAAR